MVSGYTTGGGRASGAGVEGTVSSRLLLLSTMLGPFQCLIPRQTGTVAPNNEEPRRPGLYCHTSGSMPRSEGYWLTSQGRVSSCLASEHVYERRDEPGVG